MAFSVQNLPWLKPTPEDFRARCAEFDKRPHESGVAIMSLANCRLDANKLARLTKSIEIARENGSNLAPMTEFRLGVIGNGTTCLYAPALPAAAARFGLNLEVVQADYDQVIQEATNPASTVNAARPDAVLLALDKRGLPFGDVEFGSFEQEQAAVEEAIDYLRTIRTGIAAASGAFVIYQTLAPFPDSAFGSMDRRVAGTNLSMSALFNRRLEDLARESGDYVLNVAGLAASVGLETWHDPVQWNHYKLPFSQKLVPLYVDHVSRLIAAIRGKSRKCLVLDLDNTLWSGVVGDDGLEGILVGQGDAIAEAHLDIQKMALDLHSRGIILAICSKNDDEIALQPFREHPDMLLREEHISVFQANWTDKATNIEAIAKVLNIGLDAIVFVDDNPFEREQVREALPALAVPELPEDPALIPRTVLSAGYFESVIFSQEDRARARQYRDNVKRAELQSKSRSIEDYLKSLDMVIRFAPFTAAQLPRITQLINKTNQFNLTTRRYTEKEVAELSRSPETYTLQARLRDRFGDNGIISVVIINQVGQTWDIETWLMSCRVLGRNVEDAVLHQLVRAAKEREVGEIIGHYDPTPKNSLVKDLFANFGFDLVEDEGGRTTWRLEVDGFTPRDNLPFEVEQAGTGDD